MSRAAGIIAYGTPEDRLRLAAIARTNNQSGSQVVVELIRTRYAELFGDLDPALTDKGGE